jgi:hypothetical protein
MMQAIIKPVGWNDSRPDDIDHDHPLVWVDLLASIYPVLSGRDHSRFRLDLLCLKERVGNLAQKQVIHRRQKTVDFRLNGAWGAEPIEHAHGEGVGEEVKSWAITVDHPLTWAWQGLVLAVAHLFS